MTDGTSETDFVYSVLNRSDGAFNPIARIAEGFGADRVVDPGLDPSLVRAIGFDTNALFKMASNSKAESIIDGLGAADFPLIVPGQVLQEFWNNKVEGLPKLSANLVKALSQIRTELDLLSDSFGLEAKLVELEGALSGFTKSHDGLVSSSLTITLKSLFEMLSERARVSYVPRDRFAPLGAVRHSTKTPPGFKDPSQWTGDFFVWADFLLGLSQSGLNAASSDSEKKVVVFVTEDRKKDWEVRGYVHPILEGEVTAVTGSPVQLWTVAQLAKFLER